VHPDENLCSISPEGEVVGECYVPTRDAGMLRRGQPARFQIDAFNYNYFGAAEGRILSIDNDFTLWDNQPVFKVICIFDGKKSTSSDAYRGLLKKGLTFRARFISANRSLWQLLYDKLDDWIDPPNPIAAAPEKPRP
jgi:HlyD family secretion protein